MSGVQWLKNKVSLAAAAGSRPDSGKNHHAQTPRPAEEFLPRQRVHLTMTEDERATLDEMVDLFSERFNHNFSRGHIVAFLLFYMRGLLQERGKKMTLPEDISSFTDLADYLHQKE